MVCLRTQIICTDVLQTWKIPASEEEAVAEDSPIRHGPPALSFKPTTAETYLLPLKCCVILLRCCATTDFPCGWQKENFTMRSQHILEFTVASQQLNQKTAVLWTSYVKVGSDVLTAVVMKSTIFWDTTPCSPLKVKLTVTDYTALYLTRQYSSSYVKFRSRQYLAPNSSSL
jgi:hypothetical protein